MNNFFSRMLAEQADIIPFPGSEASGKDYADYASDTPDQTNRQFINEL